MGSTARELRTILIATSAACLVAAGPSLAGMAFDAQNADKVDGKHAVGAGATKAQRKGKLVATSATTGSLPNNIIAKAPDADKLDGVDSTRLTPSAHASESACCPDLSYEGLRIVELAPTDTCCTSTGEITIAKPSRILATGHATLRTTGATASMARCWLEINDGTLPDSGLTGMTGSGLTFVSFPATSGFHITSPVAGAAQKAPGTYNVRMMCDVNGPLGSLESLGGELLVSAAPN